MHDCSSTPPTASRKQVNSKKSKKQKIGKLLLSSSHTRSLTGGLPYPKLDSKLVVPVNTSPVLSPDTIKCEARQACARHQPTRPRFRMPLARLASCTMHAVRGSVPQTSACGDDACAAGAGRGAEHDGAGAGAGAEDGSAQWRPR